MNRFRISIGLFLLATMAGESRAQTKIIDNGPDWEKKVLVVMGDGYATGADQTKYNTDVDNNENGEDRCQDSKAESRKPGPGRRFSADS